MALKPEGAAMTPWLSLSVSALEGIAPGFRRAAEARGETTDGDMLQSRDRFLDALQVGPELLEFPQHVSGRRAASNFNRPAGFAGPPLRALRALCRAWLDREYNDRA